MRLLFESVISVFPFGNRVFCTGVLSWSNPDPDTPAWPYCQTMCPAGFTNITRLSGQPLGQVGSLPAGAPVPAISVRGPTRWASFTPTTECGPATLEPSPNCQITSWVLGSTSMTRLLN